jgi:hypothetical protein
LKKTIVIAAAAALTASAVTATASTLITSAQIKNGSIQAIDMKKGTITADRLSPALRVKLNKIGIQSTGAVTGAPGAAGAAGTAGATGATGTAGATGAAGTSAVSTLSITADNKQGFYYGSIDKDDHLGVANASASIQTVQRDGAPVKAIHLDITGDNAFATVRKTLTDKPYLSSLTAAGFDYTVDAASATDYPAQIKFYSTGTAGAAGWTTLVYEPDTNLGFAPRGSWRSLNALSGGKWRSTKEIPGTTNQGGFFYGSLSDIILKNPDIRLNQLQVEQGSSGTNFVGFKGAVDNIRLGFNGETTTYDIG